MGSYIQILALIIIGILLLWFGYNLFFGKRSPFYKGLPWRKHKETESEDGEPQVCPVCSTKLLRKEQIKTVVFPLSPSGTDRMMHIHGCYSCLEDGASRKCPVCGKRLALDDFLAARMFERRLQKNHIHVLGCNICKKIPKADAAKK